MKPLTFACPASYASYLQGKLGDLFREVEQTEQARIQGDPEAVWPIPGWATDDAPGQVRVTLELTP